MVKSVTEAAGPSNVANADLPEACCALNRDPPWSPFSHGTPSGVVHLYYVGKHVMYTWPCMTNAESAGMNACFHHSHLSVCFLEWCRCICCCSDILYFIFTISNTPLSCTFIVASPYPWHTGIPGSWTCAVVIRKSHRQWEERGHKGTNAELWMCVCMCWQGGKENILHCCLFSPDQQCVNHPLLGSNSTVHW